VKRNAWLLLLLVACGALAADHNEAPAVMADPAADLNDYYVFINPDDPDELVAVVTFNPFATGATQFSDAIIYDFWFDTAEGEPSSFIRCRFDAEQRVTCTGPGDRTVSGLPGSVHDAGDFRVWAGLADDPFFFDLDAFKATLAAGAPAFSDPGTDFFAGLNTLAIVVGIDTGALPGGAVQKTWVSTARVGGTGITDALDGFWWDSTNPGEGWNFDLFEVPETGERMMSAAFYTFDTAGQRYWLVGSGPVEGNVATLAMSEFTGGSFGAPVPPGTITGTAHGTAVVTFTGCASGSVEYTPVQDFADFGEQDYVLNNRPASDAEDCQFFADTGQGDVFGKVHEQFQKDREGRPAIATALVPSGRRDEYNFARERDQWVELFAGDMAAALAVYDGLDGTAGNLLLGDADTLAAVLADDRMLIALDVPACGDYLAVELAGGGTPANCGGRTLEADVIDATLGAAVGSPVSDFVDANDRPFLEAFPYLAPPN
jgi:hypothetical protein